MKYISLALRALALIGGILILVGVFGPWISYKFYRVYLFPIPLSPDKFRLSMDAEFKSSPFTFQYTLKHIQSGNITEYGNISFYDPISSLIGIACIIGSFLGFIGPNIDRWKITLTGGALTLLSALSFFLCLPYNINKSNYNFMQHWYLTILGGILIIFTVLLKNLHCMIQKIRERSRAYKEWTPYTRAQRNGV